MSMRSWSIPVGRLFGIEIRIHLTFLFLLVFVWSTESAAQDATAALRGLGLVGIIFGSVVLHQLGHALVARGSGIPAKSIILLPIGGITMVHQTPAPPRPPTPGQRRGRASDPGPVAKPARCGSEGPSPGRRHPRVAFMAGPPMHSNA